MLLSHNFNLNNNELPALKREEFAQIFIDGLQDQEHIQCQLIDNPHWVVEIIFSTDKFEPQEIGQLCGDILTKSRHEQQPDGKINIDTLILGGKKTSPPKSASPTSLQTGEWGVDVVETARSNIFLDSINWDGLTVNKPSDGIFKLEFLTA